VEDFQRRTIDCRPDVELLAVDVDLRLIYGDLLTSPAVRLEQMLQSVKPLSDRLVRPLDERFDPAVRQPCVLQKCREDTPPRRCVFTGKYFLLVSLLDHAVEHSRVTNSV
jgi:hypothetical protein